MSNSLTIYDLSDDILDYLLENFLDIKSIIRFSCVCKKWNQVYYNNHIILKFIDDVEDFITYYYPVIHNYDLPILQFPEFTNDLSFRVCKELYNWRFLNNFLILNYDYNLNKKISNSKKLTKNIYLFDNLTELFIKSKNIIDISEIKLCPKLECMFLQCPRLKKLSNIEYCNKLISIHMLSCVSIKSIKIFEKLINLQEINIEKADNLKTLPNFKKLQKLKKINFINCPNINKLNQIYINNNYEQHEMIFCGDKYGCLF